MGADTGRAQADAALAIAALAALAALACGGEHWGPGEVTDSALPASVVAAEQARATLPPVDSSHERSAKQILFGDLHVHTTFSLGRASSFSLPA